jgi:hypothetical protein
MKTLSEYEFDQMMAEAVVRVGRDRVHQCLQGLARQHGWPIPPSKRPQVITAVAMLVKKLESGA